MHRGQCLTLVMLGCVPGRSWTEALLITVWWHQEG